MTVSVPNCHRRKTVDRFFSYQTIAAFEDCSVRTVRRRVKAKKLPAPYDREGRPRFSEKEYLKTRENLRRVEYPDNTNQTA